MGEVSTIGLDIAKSVFQVHGVDADGAVIIRKRITRAKLLEFFGALPACLVGIEACPTAHYWSRRLQGLGHTVRLMPPAYVRPSLQGRALCFALFCGLAVGEKAEAFRYCAIVPDKLKLSAPTERVVILDVSMKPEGCIQVPDGLGGGDGHARHCNITYGDGLLAGPNHVINR
jgi:hypothetical protein